MRRRWDSKKEDSLRPKEESYPKPPIDYRGHLVLASLPPLLKVEKLKTVPLSTMTTKAPRASLKSRVLTNPRSESDDTASTHSLPHASPRMKRKRDEVKDSGTSKAEEAEPSYKKAAFNPYTDALVSSYRDYSKKLEGDLAKTNKHADALAVKLEQSEEARKKAEKDAAAIEDLRKRLHDAETSLSNNIARQSAREAKSLPAWSRRLDVLSGELIKNMRLKVLKATSFSTR
ncbi:hypothetical protein QYE76_038147 [Lolium multiflorum]|uniref:Uncharacterized protein n=1 Tax=Lolium multiflorum TaxID=4521 RepID=A0AAD8WQZ4_LOLMU|nr:hypothetical protein QYE76_038147 [Lolium multiflorum]